MLTVSNPQASMRPEDFSPGNATADELRAADYRLQ